MDDPFDLPPDVLARVPLFAELSRVLSWQGGPVNWDLARQVAVSIAAGEQPPRAVDGSDHEQASEHVRIAELWLAESTGLPLPAHVTSVRAATAIDWAEHAAGIYPEVVDPVAVKVTRVMGEHIGSLGDQVQGNPLIQALGQLSPMLLGIQVGSMLGAMSSEALSSHDDPLPAGDGELLLLLDAIDATAREYSLDPAGTRQLIALRAAARRMQLDGFAWVRANFYSQYHNYVASLDVDLAAGMQRLQQLDLSNPERLQEILSNEGLFEHQPSPDTARAAARVSRSLALLDAHADAAVETAGVRTGDVGRITEALSRRSIEAGAGIRSLWSFIGLDPGEERRIATTFVRSVLDRGGWPGVNRIWEEPEAFPTDDELGDPDAWLRRTS